MLHYAVGVQIMRVFSKTGPDYWHQIAIHAPNITLIFNQIDTRAPSNLLNEGIPLAEVPPFPSARCPYFMAEGISA